MRTRLLTFMTIGARGRNDHKWFDSAGMTEAVNNTQAALQKVETTFKSL